MKRLSIFLIFLIIAISGCVGQDGFTVSTKDGVAITDFSFEYSPVYAKENVGLRLEVQNVGGSKATLKKIQVYGVDFGSDDRDWGIRNDDAIKKLNEELYQPDPDINLEGAKYYHEWRLKAPSEVLAETKYDFVARVEYDYTTTYTGIIRLVNEDYLQSLSDEDRQKLYGSGGIISSELTNGPISVIPYSGRHFIVDDLSARNIKFKIENVGKGYTYLCPVGRDCVNDDPIANKSYVRIETRGDISCNGEVKLSSGKSHVIDCTFTPSSVENKVDKTFQIELEYSYYIDDFTSITVNPTFEGGGGDAAPSGPIGGPGMIPM